MARHDSPMESNRATVRVPVETPVPLSVRETVLSPPHPAAHDVFGWLSMEAYVAWVEVTTGSETSLRLPRADSFLIL